MMRARIPSLRHIGFSRLSMSLNTSAPPSDTNYIKRWARAPVARIPVLDLN